LALECPLTAFFPPSIILPLFENESCSKKSSSIKLSVGIGVVIGENSSSVFAADGGVLGRLPFVELGFLQRLTLPEPMLSLLVNLGVLGICVGVSGVFAACGLELKFIAIPSALSSTVFTEPSRALDDVVGARPESLFDSSFSSAPVLGLRRAGCVSVGGARGGATVTAIGGFAGIVSSYRNVIIPLSVRVCCCVVIIEFVRKPPDVWGAILHDSRLFAVLGSGQSRLSTICCTVAADAP
jgi:hypothetical protein